MKSRKSKKTLLFCYSERSAITGSFLLAILEGICPAITFNKILNSIKKIALPNGILATDSIPARADTIKFTGILINKAIPIPSKLALKP